MSQLLQLTDVIHHGEREIRIGGTPYVGVQLRVSSEGQLFYAEKAPNGHLNSTVIAIAKQASLLPFVDWRQYGTPTENLLSSGAHSENQVYPYYLLQFAALIAPAHLHTLSETIEKHLQTIPVPTS